MRVSHNGIAAVPACARGSDERCSVSQSFSTGDLKMSPSHHAASNLALSAAAYAMLMGSWVGALVLWSRRCEVHKDHVR
jgi:hypothetical protein